MSKAAELAKAGETLTNQPSGRKNLVTNGAMQVAQRSTSETGKGGDQGYFTVDRMLYFENGTTDVRFTQSQSTDVPTGEGFATSLKFDCTTADASLASDNQLVIKHRIEGQDIQQLKWGTSNAEKVTLCFWIKSTKTGTFIIELSRESRKISQAYTVSSSDTWEKKTLTFDGDTGGSVVTNDSANRLEINFYMGVGTNYSSGTLDTAWTGGTNANRAVGQVNAFDNTSNNILFTGVQMEIGSQATNFEHRSFGEELALCQRYFYQDVKGVTQEISVGWYYSSSAISWIVNFPVPMRASPTMAYSGPTDGFTIYRDGAADNFTALTIENVNYQYTRASCFNTNQVSGTAGQAGIVRATNAACLVSFSADL
jgi:hypothetical protein